MKMPLINRPFWLLTRFYQIVFSPFIGRSCRFYPTCSNYALWLLEKRALYVALPLIAWRVLRCNPLCEGGIDYPTTSQVCKTRSPIGVWANARYKKDNIIWFYVPCGGGYMMIKARKNGNAI
jgi:putative membrane protein insertion efficiency factor